MSTLIDQVLREVQPAMNVESRVRTLPTRTVNAMIRAIDDLSELVEQKWQPIDTAPKDRPIIAVSALPERSKDIEKAESIIDLMYQWTDKGWQHSSGLYDGALTHWLPPNMLALLPQPPTQQEGE